MDLARAFDRILAFEPEEAISLGLPDQGAWRRWDEAGVGAERAWYTEVLAHEPAEDPDSLALQRWARARLAAIDDPPAQADAVLLPQATLTLELLRGPDPEGWLRLAARVAALPRFFEELTAHHRRGPPLHAETVEALQEHELPGFIDSLDPAHPRWHGAPPLALGTAQAALRRYADDLSTVVGPGPEPPGEARLAARLQQTMGVDTTLQALLSRAEARLAETESALRDAVALATGRVLGESAQLPEILAELLVPRPADEAALLTLYETHTRRAVALVERLDPGLLPTPWELHIAPAPPGLTHAANWPAPLMDPSRGGVFFLAPDPAAHPVAWSADLAVHEGVPGHYLQSVVWQRTFGAERAPLRCLFLSDPVAIAHHYWGPMIGVEGWAVYAEAWMRREGFFTPTEQVCALVSDAIRFARLIGDLSLQCGWATEAEVAALLSERCGLGPGTVQGELHRYRRIPLQASTYALGLFAIEDLEAGWSGPGFRRWLLEQGPWLPARPRRRRGAGP